MAMSKQERPSIDDMQEQLRKVKEAPSQEVDLFHGLILFEKGSQNIVEGDGGCFSRMKDAKGIKGIVRQLSDGSTMTETKKSIVIRSIPNGDKPGKMEILGSSAIEFYSGDRALEATDHEVIISVPYGPDNDSKFHLKSKSTENDQYLMVNDSQRCVCLKVKDDGNELVSLKVDEAEREESCIYRYITVYEDNSSSSLNNIALFFTYKKSNQKTYNCYLVPNDSSSEIDLPEIEVGGKSYDELRVLHEKYLKFSTSPGSLESTSDAENTEPDKKVAAGNNEASPTSSFSDHSVD